MALERTYRPLARCLYCAHQNSATLPVRSFSTTSSAPQEVTETPSAETSVTPSSLDKQKSHLADIVHSPRSERRLIANHGIYPIGSRRRRAAIATSPNVPFHQLPYQCFQEARKFLQEDRKEKVKEVEDQRRRIEKLKAKIAKQEELQDDKQRIHQETQLRSMNNNLAELKILADINDPIVKKKFEDGMGDMNKPIYRHLADLQWRSYKRKVLVQRITQMNVVPDIMPHIDSTVSVSLSFGRKNVQHGDFVLSTISEQAPTLNIQPYNKGERWITIAVVNPDVPNVSKDAFDYRCHFLASNIKISPTQTRVELANLDAETQVIQDWLPAFAQKGLPYQRMGIFVLEQEAYEQDKATLRATQALRERLDKIYDPNPIMTSSDLAVTESSESADAVAESTSSSILPILHIKKRGRYTVRNDFILRSFSSKFNLKPVGVDLFRTQWDEGTAGVMERAEIIGADVEFKRKRVEPLPYQRLKSERYR